ncbi:MAG: hypothetical protein ABH875_01965 [Candidatus Omnitrophota bacterium]
MKSYIFFMKAAMISLFIFLHLSANGTCAGDEAQHAGQAQVREMSGTVTYYTPRNAPAVIGVADNQSNYDYSFRVTKETKLDHAQRWGDIARGDTVKVVFTDMPKVVKGYKVNELTAKKVTLLKKMRYEAPAQGDESGSGTLVSE